MYTTPPSIARSQPEVSSADIRQLCQAQIDRLSEKLPVLDVWLVCWNQLENKRDKLSYRRSQAGMEHVKSYLESERWISENLSFLELTPLTLGSEDSQAYVCGLGKTDTHWDYLLLWTEQQISSPQQSLVKEYAQLLQQYITLYQENLRQQAKVHLLEQALHQAEHQLRNPIALIRLYAETIALGAESTEQKYQADRIRQTADDISSQLGDLLSCGKRDCLKRENHSLLTLLQRVTTLLKPRLDQKQLTIVQPSRSVSVTADGWQLEQVLQNIVDNAIHFSPIGGTITIDWQISQYEIRLQICDQGPGFGGTEGEVFTPFYSKRSGGSGLGLSIAKKIVLDHHGSIWADTLPQGGARFSIVLPY